VSVLEHGQVESIGIFTAVKMAHLSDDETVAKMGHPVVVERLRCVAARPYLRSI